MPAPTTTTKISQIPEEESSPTPPVRRKRDKPIKITRKDSKSSGESTPSDSPKKVQQESMSSTDSSPLLNKVTKQEVTSSTENSPLIHKVTKEDMISPDKKDTMKKGTLSASHLPTKEKVSPKPSGNGRLINVTGSFADEIMEQFDTKAIASSSDELRSSEDTGPNPTVRVEDTNDTCASEITKMKSRGHSRTHSAPLILDEEQPKTVSDKIAVTTVDIVTTASSDQNKDIKGKDDKEKKEAPPIMVHYLGPLVLRKEVESLLIREGLSYLEREDFPVLSPTVFWNLVSVPSILSSRYTDNLFQQVWYFTRLGLSSYLPRQALAPFTDYIDNKVTMYNS